MRDPCGRLVLIAVCALAAGALAQSQAPNDIDWTKAQQLMQRYRAGQKLTSEEQTYLEAAKAARQKGLSQPARSRPFSAPASAASTGRLVPLDQMRADESYKGQDGGLYGGGLNQPPAEHQKLVSAELARIVPLDAHGKSADDGRIVLLSIGMSNTTQEFSRFKEIADKDPDKSPAVVIVDCAQGGRDAACWSGQTDNTWATALQRLKAAGVTPQQVQAIWLKQARRQPAQLGEFPKHAQELEGHVVASLQIARQTFPNLRVAYLSSRIYAAYANTSLNPEPYAYEGAFAMRWIIQDQIKGIKNLNFDAAKGEVKSPLVLWGPYLWADGMTPRKRDGLIWERKDLGPDGTHPSPASGRDKVAALLLKFFKSDDNARGWFVKK